MERKRAGPAALAPAALKDLYERKARALHRRPDLARCAGQTRVRLAASGLSCEVDAGDGPVVVDLPPNEGGTGAAPGPAELLRASLGAALAMGYRLWAARLDVPIDAVEIDVVAEFDARGALLRETEAPVGWQRLIFAVTIHSPALAAEVARVVTVANARCPVLATLSAAIARVHLLTVIAPGGPEPETERPRSVAGHACSGES